MQYLGEYRIDDWITFGAQLHRFSSGAVYAPTGNVTYTFYENNSTTGAPTGGNLAQLNSKTGLYTARVQLTAASGFEAGKDYLIHIEATVDSVAAATLLMFRIVNNPKVDVDTIKTQAVTCAAGVTVLASVGTASTSTAQTGDAYARLGAPAGASIAADIAAIEAQTDDIGAAGAGLTAVPWNPAWDAEVESECTDALNSYDPPTKAELDTAVANVSVDEIQASALADLFNTDSGTTYGAAVSGSPVKEIADNAGGSALTEAGIADAVWDEALSGHNGSGSAGEALAAAGAAGDPWLTALPGSYAAGTAGKIIGDNINAPIATVDTVVDAIKAQTDKLAFTGSSPYEVKADVVDWKGAAAPAMTGDAFARLGAPAGASVSADVAAIKAETAAILTDTGTTLDGKIDTAQADLDILTGADGATLATLQANYAPAKAGDEMDLVNAPNATALAAAAAAILDLANGIETGYTVRQTLRLVAAALCGKLSGANTTEVTIRDITDAKNRIVATVDADGNRSAVTLTGT